MKWGNKLAPYHTNLGKTLRNHIFTHLRVITPKLGKSTYFKVLFLMVLMDFPEPGHRRCLFFFLFFWKSSACARARWALEQERARRATTDSKHGARERKINGGSVNRLFLNWFMSKVEKTVQGYIQFRYKNTLPSSFYHWASHRNSEAALWRKLKGAQWSEPLKSGVPIIRFVWNVWDLLVAREQKLGPPGFARAQPWPGFLLLS